ncbi:MAG: response regulator transcription factor [Gemmatimonadaceae bacterium]
MSSAAPNRTSLILVEDSRLLRQGLAAMVSRHEDFQVLAAIGDRDNVLQKVQELQPHVVLLDLGLRSQNSLRLVESISKEYPDVKLIVMDLLPAEADVIEFVKAGVSGFLTKDATFEEFLNTIRLVAQGTKVLPPSLTSSLFSQIAHLAATRDKALVSSAVRLTKREREIIRLIGDGQSNKEIAQALNVATFTVKSHVHNILEKLALRTRLQVASFYAREGSISMDAVQRA